MPLSDLGQKGRDYRCNPSASALEQAAYDVSKESPKQPENLKTSYVSELNPINTRMTNPTRARVHSTHILIRVEIVKKNIFLSNTFVEQEVLSKYSRLQQITFPHATPSNTIFV